eukprot:122011_1
MTSNKLWISTYINTSNVQNVHLYVPRKKGVGTYFISVRPSDYTDTLDKHNIKIESLNIPSVCPTIDHKYLQEKHKFSERKCNQVQNTVNILWNITQSHMKVKNTHSEQQTPDVNAMSIDSKLDLIMDRLGLIDDKKSKQLEQENKKLNIMVIKQKTEMNHMKQIISEKNNKIQKLQKDKKRKNDSAYYYKNVALKQRETLKLVGLNFHGIIIHCGYRQLTRRVKFIQAYLRQMYGDNANFINDLLCKFVFQNSNVKQCLYTNIFKGLALKEFQKDIRKFELDMAHCMRCMIAHHHKFISRASGNELRNANSYQKATYQLLYENNKPTLHKQKQDRIQLSCGLTLPRMNSVYLLRKA